ncbi:hypothetical protein, partial [Pedobacter sp. UBA4863]
PAKISKAVRAYLGTVGGGWSKEQGAKSKDWLFVYSCFNSYVFSTACSEYSESCKEEQFKLLL